jgi:hypothetical protein
LHGLFILGISLLVGVKIGIVKVVDHLGGEIEESSISPGATKHHV